MTAEETLDDEMSESTLEHINKIEHLKGWIIEAMKIYSQRIAKEQREICAKSLNSKFDVEEQSRFPVSAEIYNAPGPKFN